jgi:hypothetical protein
MKLMAGRLYRVNNQITIARKVLYDTSTCYDFRAAILIKYAAHGQGDGKALPTESVILQYIRVQLAP